MWRGLRPATARRMDIGGADDGVSTSVKKERPTSSSGQRRPRQSVADNQRKRARKSSDPLDMVRRAKSSEGTQKLVDIPKVFLTLGVAKADVLATALTIFDMPSDSQAEWPSFGYTIGLEPNRLGGVCSAHTTKIMHLTLMLTRFFASHQKDTFFSSVDVRRNTKSALHVRDDRIGPTFTYGAGDFEGGQLLFQKAGKIETKKKIVKYNTSVPHAVCAFFGRVLPLVLLLVICCRPHVRQDKKPFVGAWI